MTENVTKVYLTPTEQKALCYAACHYDERALLEDLAERLALKDAILKVKGMAAPDEPSRLTKAEMGALCEIIIDLDMSRNKGKRIEVLGSPALVSPLMNALGKLQMALYPEDGIPQ